MRAVFLLFAFCAFPALAASGEEVYGEVCVACHGTKFDKAPQLGDRQAWAPRLQEGQATVTAHDLPLEDFARAVAYMARQAGGRWRDPDAALLAKIQAEMKQHRHDSH